MEDYNLCTQKNPPIAGVVKLQCGGCQCVNGGRYASDNTMQGKAWLVPLEKQTSSGGAKNVEEILLHYLLDTCHGTIE